MDKGGKTIDYGELIIPVTVVAYIAYNLGMQFYEGYHTSTIAYGLLLAFPLLICLGSIVWGVFRGKVATRPHFALKAPVMLLAVNALLVALLPFIGYQIAFAIYLVAAMRWFHVKSWLKIGLLTVAVVVIVHLVFVMWMEVPLPQGVLFEEGN